MRVFASQPLVNGSEGIELEEKIGKFTKQFTYIFIPP